MKPSRIAVISVHTSPLAQPGTGDAGGMNVYVWQTALQLAKRGVEVEIFTRATSSVDAPIVHPVDGITVRNVAAGPFEGLDKQDLPTQLCAFTAGVLRAEATHPPGYYGLVHSHYWLSGQVGWLARDRWRVPLVHTAHTLAAVKNASLAQGDEPEPMVRQIGEQQVVDEADRLIANTEAEAAQLISLHNASPDRVDVATPGVDLECYRPGSRSDSRARIGNAGLVSLGPDDSVVTFVGRIQPLKAPDVLIRAIAPLIATNSRLRVLVVGGPSGNGLQRPDSLIELVQAHGIARAVTFLPPQAPKILADIYRASNIVVVPSYSESFGLVAIEAQASGIPVLAADVGGLGVAVANGKTGRLVSGHDIEDWTSALAGMLSEPDILTAMGKAAARHAQRFSWANTADNLLSGYSRAMQSFAVSTGVSVDAMADAAPRKLRRWSRRRMGVRI